MKSKFNKWKEEKYEKVSRKREKKVKFINITREEKKIEKH